MAFFPVRRVRNRQPQHVVGLSQIPIRPELVFLAPLGPKDLAWKTLGSVSGALANKTGIPGVGLSVTGNTQNGVFFSGGNASFTPSVTFIVVFDWLSGAANNYSQLVSSSSGNSGFRLNLISATGPNLVLTKGGLVHLGSGLALSSGAPYALVCSHRSDTGETYMLLRNMSNGVIEREYLVDTITPANGNGTYVIGNGSLHIAGSWNGTVYSSYMSFDFLPENIGREVVKNPWQIFEPEERFFYISSGTGGAYTLTASGGTYTVQGASAGIFRSRVLSGTGGSYTLTGGQAVVSRNRKLGASGGTYNYTGQSITITHTGTSNAYTLTAQGGSYALSGGSALILKSKRITSVGGVYTLTGSDAVVLKSKYLTAASGTYSLTGGTATVLKSKMLISTGGVYSYTGSSTVIKKSKYLSALGGSYSLVGSSVVLVHGGIGGIVWPPTHLVVLGTVYGPTGSEYTGTLDVNGIKYDITTGQLVKPISDKVVMSL